MIPLNMVNGPPNNTIQFIQSPQFYPMDHANKVLIVSPPPSFRVMGGVNNVNNNNISIVQNPILNQ